MYLKEYGLSKKKETEILKTDKSYQYWIDTLFEKCVKMFRWKGLPLSIPQKEIETRLILQGYCGFLKDSKVGLMVASGSMSGVTQYYDEFTTFTYAVPTAMGGNKRINKECVIIDNNTLRNPLFPMICRYSSLLAHADVSLKCALVNMRETNTFVSDDSSTADSVRAYHKKAYDGELDVIIDESLMENIKNISTPSLSQLSPMDCVDVRNELLRSFFNEIGIRATRDKKERMVESEVNNDTQLLTFNITDMTDTRKESCKKINKMFGLNVSVELSPEYELINTVSTPKQESEVL